MKILLINANPVVSRLLALCTRDVDIVLDEVKNVDTVQSVDYDMLFVNDASYVDHIDTLLENKRLRKKVFISYDEEPVKGFDHTVKKPFLPSQIIELIESVDMSEVIEVQEEEDILLSTLSTEEESEEEALPPIFSLPTEKEEALDDTLALSDGTGTEVLDGDEIEKIKALLDMDDDETVLPGDESISDDEYEARKVKVIKEQLIADGLEIIEEDAIVEELSTIIIEPDEAIKESSNNKKKNKKKKEKRIVDDSKNVEEEMHIEEPTKLSYKTEKKNKKSKRKKETALNKNERSRIEDAVIVALDKMKPKKLKKLLKGKKIEIKIKLEDDK